MWQTSSLSFPALICQVGLTLKVTGALPETSTHGVQRPSLAKAGGQALLCAKRRVGYGEVWAALRQGCWGDRGRTLGNHGLGGP